MNTEDRRRECIWANRDRQSSIQRETQPSLNLSQAAVCSKNDETPYCKGNTIMRFAVGKYRPDRAMANAKQKARKKKERHRHKAVPCPEKTALGLVGTERGGWAAGPELA